MPRQHTESPPTDISLAPSPVPYIQAEKAAAKEAAAAAKPAPPAAPAAAAKKALPRAGMRAVHDIQLPKQVRPAAYTHT